MPQEMERSLKQICGKLAPLNEYIAVAYNLTGNISRTQFGGSRP
jgi:hypothetical protein